MLLLDVARPGTLAGTEAVRMSELVVSRPGDPDLWCAVQQLAADGAGAFPVADTQTAPTVHPDVPAQSYLTSTARPAAPVVLYDAVRGLYYPKPTLRGWMHLIWFEMSVVLGTLLIAHAHGARHVVAAAVFAGSVSGLFGASALYHRGSWGPGWTAALQRLDHTMIFVVIAATATPVFLVAAPGTIGVIGLCALWALTAAAGLIHLA